MEEPNYGSTPAYTVRDPIQAKLLRDPKSFQYFIPFLARTCTASHAAEEADCKLDTMIYRIRTFLKARLLEVVEIEKRAGRPIKHYRSVFDSYYVPSNVTPYADYEEEARQTLRMYEDSVVKALARTRRSLKREGLRIFRDERGDVNSHSAANETHMIHYDSLPELARSREFEVAAAAEIFSDELFLTDGEARALLSDLYKVWRESKQEEAPSRGSYLLRVIMVPLESG